MGAARLVHDSGVEACGVVGAQQPERRRARKGEVQERLVVVALDQLGRRTARPDRLADPAQRPPVVRVDEVTPRRNDPCRIASQRGHVDELHRVGLGSQLGLQRSGALRTHGDQDGLPGPHPVADERNRPGQELVLAGIQQRLVMKCIVAGVSQFDPPGTSRLPPPCQADCHRL
jgi:hypothetical protein